MDCGDVRFNKNDVAAFRLAVSLQIVELGLNSGPSHRLCRMALGLSLIDIADVYGLPPSGCRDIEKIERSRKRIPTDFWITLRRRVRQECDALPILPRVLRLTLVK
jgi:hypothetical protein